MDAFRIAVPHCPDGGFLYIPEFVSSDEEAYLVRKYWGGQIAERSGMLVPETLPPFFTQFPPLVERLRDTGVFSGSKHQQPNHCLVNEYEPGQGIMAHKDGPAYFPAVATISLCAPILLDLYEPKVDGTLPPEPAFSILQEPRSLLITYGAAYTQYLHGIAERDVDTPADLARVCNVDPLGDAALRQVIERAQATSTSVPRARRVSLTFRDVERVAPSLRLR